MEFLDVIWTLITSHWLGFLGALTATKLGADTFDSIKKLMPEHLEAKKITQDHLETSMALLNDQSIKIEDKKWELTTRQELVKSMVHLTAIEATYNIARVTVVAAFSTVALHFLMRIFFTGRREP